MAVTRSAYLATRGTAITLLVLASLLQGVARADDSALYDFEFQQQSLLNALRAYTALTSIQVLVPSAHIKQIQSNAVIGRFTARDALERLVADSTFLVRRVNADTFILETDAPNGWAPPRTAVIEEIVVRGERIDRRLQDVQSSVKVFTSAKLERHPDHDLLDLLERTAGAIPLGNGRGISIRGISDAGGGAGAKINITVDGAVLPSDRAVYTGPISTWDLEQVEVLRGPQSTQSGINALAGAIHIRSRDPNFERALKVRTDFGSNDEQRLAIAGNLPLSDQVALRISLEDYSWDGDLQNRTTGAEIGQRELRNYRGKLRFRPSDRVDLVAFYTGSDSQHGRQVVIRDLFPERRVADENDTETADTESAGVRMQFAVSNAWTLDLEATVIDNDFTLLVPADPNAPFFLEGVSSVDARSMDLDISAVYRGPQLQATFGAYAIDIESTDVFDIMADAAAIGLPIPGVTANIASNGLTETRNYAVFGELEYDFSERWTLIAGARYDYEEQDNFATSLFELDPPVFSFPPEPPEDRASDYSAFLPKLGAVYHWNDHLSLGLTVQRGYRAGGSAIALDGSTYEFDPEFTNNYELSFRASWLEGRLTTNANVFFTDWTDQQIFVLGPSGSTIDGFIDNAGESELYGFEFEGALTWSDRGEAFLSFAFSRTQFNELFVPNGGALDDLSGNEFPDAPRWTASIGGDYRFGSGWVVSLEGSFTDESYFQNTNRSEELSDQYFLINARIGYEAERWSASLYARNALDREYRSRMLSPTLAAAGDSRVFGISLSAEI